MQRKVNVQSGIIGAFLDYTDAIVPRVRQWFQAGKEFKDLLPRGEVHGEVSDPLSVLLKLVEVFPHISIRRAYPAVFLRILLKSATPNFIYMRYVTPLQGCLKRSFHNRLP